MVDYKNPVLGISKQITADQVHRYLDDAIELKS
jgi:hypothetical protein